MAWSTVHQQKKNEVKNKMWCAFIMEIILVIENRGIFTCVGNWVELEIIVLSELKATRLRNIILSHK